MLLAGMYFWITDVFYGAALIGVKRLEARASAVRRATD
jgi:hypothetical protein